MREGGRERRSEVAREGTSKNKSLLEKKKEVKEKDFDFSKGL